MYIELCGAALVLLTSFLRGGAPVRLRATNGKQLLCSVFADALLRFQCSMFTDGVPCAKEGTPGFEPGTC